MTARAFHLGLAAYLLVVLYAGWLPLNFHYDPAGFAKELHEGWHTWPNGAFSAVGPADVAVNLLVFVPVGLLLAAGRMGKSRWRWAIPLAATGLSAATSLAVEAGQLFLFDRVACLSDLALNTLGGLAGGVLGLALLGTRVRGLWPRAARAMKRRPAWTGAGIIAAALAVLTASPHRPDLSVAPMQWAQALRALAGGLGEHTWPQWLFQVVSPYMVLALLLARAGGNQPGRRRMWLAGAAAGLAVALQAWRLVTPGPAPDLAELAVAVLAAGAGAAIAPRMAPRRIELPAAVLVCGAALVALSAYVTWLVRTGAYAVHSPLPLWGLYLDENLGEACRALARWASVAGFSFMLAFYLSVRTRWTLRVRLVLSLIGAAACSVGVEMLRLAWWHGTLDLAALGEQVMAAGAGGLIFAVVWPILDRRGGGQGMLQYAGPERRRARR